MDGVFSEHALAGSSCSGKRPWLASAPEECHLQSSVAQRGATNLYYPVTQSALSIPPWSDDLREALGQYWHGFTNIEDPIHRRVHVRALNNALREALDQLGLDIESLCDAIDARIALGAADTLPDVRPEEYRQFVLGTNTSDRNFDCRRENVPASLTPWISTLARVPRLREVRALTGFTRIHAPNTKQDQVIAPLSLTSKSWLPAIEVKGEGIFFSLNASALTAWEQRPDVSDRIRSLQQTWTVGANEVPPSARFLLIHTLAHSFMRQLTLECGYSTASLRERLYVSSGGDGMSGI
jgi:hypothetical protein